MTPDSSTIIPDHPNSVNSLNLAFRELRAPSLAFAKGTPNAVDSGTVEEIAREQMTIEGLPTIIGAVENLARRVVNKNFRNLQKNDVDDIVQQTLLNIAKRIGTFDTSQPANRWIARVAINATNDWLEKRKKNLHGLGQLRDSPSDYLGRARGLLPADAGDHSCRMLSGYLTSREETLRLRRVWEALEERDTKGAGLREILLLKSLDYSNKQIAAILGVRETTIWGRCYSVLPTTLSAALKTAEQGDSPTV